MMYFSRQEEGNGALFLYEVAGFFNLGMVHPFSRVEPAPLGLLYGALVDAIHDPSRSMVVGQIILTRLLGGSHQIEPRIGMPQFLFQMELVPAGAAFLGQIKLLFQPSRYRHQFPQVTGHRLGLD